MINNKIVYLLLSFLCISFYSCNRDELICCENSEVTEESNMKYLSAEEVQEIEAGMKDTTVYYINTDEDFKEILEKISLERDLNLQKQGFTKVEKFDEELIKTRSGDIQFLNVKVGSMSTPIVEYSEFKAKFSESFCNEINSSIYVQDIHSISPKKTYICGWRNAGSFYDLAANQEVAAMDSPQGALIPSTKTGYKLRGYEGYVNSYRNFVIHSHQLAISHEDVKGTTLLLDIRYPLDGVYIYNFAVLTI